MYDQGGEKYVALKQQARTLSWFGVLFRLAVIGLSVSAVGTGIYIFFLGPVWPWKIDPIKSWVEKLSGDKKSEVAGETQSPSHDSSDTPPPPTTLKFPGRRPPAVFSLLMQHSPIKLPTSPTPSLPSAPKSTPRPESATNSKKESNPLSPSCPRRKLKASAPTPNTTAPSPPTMRASTAPSPAENRTRWSACSRISIAPSATRPRPLTISTHVRPRSRKRKRPTMTPQISSTSFAQKCRSSAQICKSFRPAGIDRFYSMCILFAHRSCFWKRRPLNFPLRHSVFA